MEDQSSTTIQNHFSGLLYDDLREFLKNDTTHKNKYSDGYVCQDYANELVGNALKNGIPACTVFLKHDKGSHSLVAFNTTDEGITFVEPQTSEFVIGLKEGEDYCELAGWKCNWNIEELKHCFDQ